MENPTKIEIEGLKTIHKLCKFGADRNMEGCSFTEIVERMFDELQQAQQSAVPDGFVLVDSDAFEEIKDSFSLLQEDIAVHRDYGTEHTATRDFNEILDRVTKLKSMIEAQEQTDV